MRDSLASLLQAHLGIVAAAMACVLAFGVPLAVWASRPSGRAFAPLLANTAAIGQTFPPVAVLFLALPVFGFGPQAVVLALFVYGLMPVLQGTLVGLQQVDPQVLDSARGMGMGERELLWRVALPLALPSMLAGIRTSLVLLISTATLAPMVGGRSLGTPIIAGLTVGDGAQVLQGAAAVALLAVAADAGLRALQRRLCRWA